MGMLCVLTLNQVRELLLAQLAPIPLGPSGRALLGARGGAGQLDSASQPDDLHTEPGAWKSLLSPADHTGVPRAHGFLRGCQEHPTPWADVTPYSVGARARDAAVISRRE